MTTLRSHEYHRATKLLDAAPFNTLMARAVVERRMDGEVFADATRATSVYVRHAYGMSFVLGYGEDERYRDELVATLADRGARSGPEMLQVYPLDWTERLDPLVERGDLTRWGRTNFWFNRTRFESDHGHTGTRPRAEASPHGPLVNGDSVVVPCTLALLERFDGSVIPRRFWRSLEAFLETGAGYTVVDPGSGEPASVAFAAYLDPRFLEIGVETAPAYRGRGCARAACVQLIRRCLERGLTPVWSCRTENEGSMALARSLGFEPVLQLSYYELPRAG